MSILRITVATTGMDPDSDGYALEMNPAVGTAPLRLPDSGSVDVRVSAGTYWVKLLGIAANCTVVSPQWETGGGAGDVQVPRGQPAVLLSFAVACERIPTARLAAGTQLAFVRNGQIWRVNSDGSDPVQLTSGPVDPQSTVGPFDSDPAWSPDGKRVAFARSNRRDQLGAPMDQQIFVMNADGSNVVRLTNGPYDHAPTWSPDGQRLSFTSLCPEVVDPEEDAREAKATHICVVVAGTDPADTSRTVVGWPRGVNDWPAWSPDGKRIAFTSDWVAFDYTSDLYTATVGSWAITQLTYTFQWLAGQKWYEFYQPAWSPDGRQLAVVVCPALYYDCDSSELALINVSGGGGPSLVRTRGFTRPTWSPDGRTIAFASGGSIQWVSADGSARGLIVADGESPAWRP